MAWKAAGLPTKPAEESPMTSMKRSWRSSGTIFEAMSQLAARQQRYQSRPGIEPHPPPPHDVPARTDIRPRGGDA